jgi:S-adenosylhomocysteine hydrolase
MLRSALRSARPPEADVASSHQKARDKPVRILAEHLDEKAASLHLAKIRAGPTKMTPEQARCLGVSAGRPLLGGN